MTRPIRHMHVHANVQTHVLRMFPARTCATCNENMTSVPAIWPKGRPFPRSMSTRGHVAPSSHPERRVWIPQCHGCNSDQAGMYLADWVARLREASDPRAEVAAAALRKLTGDGIWCGCPHVKGASAIRALKGEG